MTDNIDKITTSKTAFRTKLAQLPIGAKLQLLDKMRERELSIRRSAPPKPDPKN